VSTELGRIEKPEAEPIKGERKIYLAPLVPVIKDAPAEYTEKVERYWTGVREHVLNLENRIGVIKHVYHEAVSEAGDEGLRLAEQFSPDSAAIAKQKVEQGAHFEALEDRDVLAEMTDWQRCLMTGLVSQNVADKVWGFYTEAVRKRNEEMAKRLDETLQPAEAGILFISENYQLQFPSDIQVFYVSPPALDEIHRWLRDRAAKTSPAGNEGEDVKPT